MSNIFYKLIDLSTNKQILEKGFYYPFSSESFYSNKNDYIAYINNVSEQIENFLSDMSSLEDPLDFEEFSKTTFDLDRFIYSIKEEINEIKNFCEENNLNIFIDEINNINNSISSIYDIDEIKKIYLSYNGGQRKKSFSSYSTVSATYKDISTFFDDDCLISNTNTIKSNLKYIEELKKTAEDLEQQLESFNNSIKDFDYEESTDEDYDELIEMKDNIEKSINENEKILNDYIIDFFDEVERFAINAMKFTEVYKDSKVLYIIESVINEIEDLKQEIIEAYREQKKDFKIGKSDAQIYLESSHIQRVILDKQNQTQSFFKLNYNNFTIFQDDSYLFSQSTNKYIIPSSDYELRKISDTFLNLFIEHFFRKHPIYIDLFKRNLSKNKSEKKENIIEALNIFNRNLSFVEKYFNPLENFKNIKFEQIADLIQNKLIDVKIDNHIKSIFSNKNKHLHTDRTHKELKNLIAASSLSSLKDVEKKLALFTVEVDFNNFIINLKKELSGFNSKSFLMKMDDTSKVIYTDEKNNMLILKISTFDQSKKLGTEKWCISRSSSYFYNYANDRCQYFVYDFTKEASDKFSKIGITLNQNGIYHTAHYGNDSKAQETNIQNIIKIIYENDTSLILSDTLKEKYKLINIDNIKENIVKRPKNI